MTDTDNCKENDTKLASHMCLHVFNLMDYIMQYNRVVISCLERIPKLRSTCVSVLEAYIVPNAIFVDVQFVFALLCLLMLVELAQT